MDGDDAGRRQRAGRVLENGDAASAQLDVDACHAANRKAFLPEVDVHLRWWTALRTGLAGDTTTAETLSRQAFEAHQRTVWGAEPALAAQVASWLLDRGRYHDLETAIRAGWHVGSPITSTNLALTLALQGRLSEAGTHCPPAAEVPEPPQDWPWLLQMVMRAYTWALCGDVESCRYALARLLPYSGRAVTNGSGILCWGSIDHFLGEVAEGSGNRTLAIALFTKALHHDIALDAVHWSRRSRGRLADLTTPNKRADEHGTKHIS